MTQSKIETFEISIPAAPPGIPPKVGQRLAALGPGNQVARGDVEDVVGGRSAANMFMANGVEQGWLVPVGWNAYRVASNETLHVLGRLGHPLHRRLVSWSHVLPEAVGRPVCFAAPRLWRDTDLSVDDLLPVVPLRRRERRVAGLAPQWDAFYQDLVDPPERWKLVAGDEPLAMFRVPSANDLGVMLVASLDPRWRQALRDVRGADFKMIEERVTRLGVPAEAPRGSATARVGLGLPHRIRLLAPHGFLDDIMLMARESAVRYATEAAST